MKHFTTSLNFFSNQVRTHSDFLFYFHFIFILFIGLFVCLFVR
jgi:hypothetical protein